MRNYWNKHIEKLWTNGYQSHPIRGQTFWMFHLKTNMLKSRFARNTKIRHFVSIKSMHFVFPFCTYEVGYIVVPISKETWETEANRLSDFSSFNTGRQYTGPLDF